MDGKLDYQEGTVLMNHPANSVYQQVSSKGEVPLILLDPFHFFLILHPRSLNVLKEVFSGHQY